MTTKELRELHRESLLALKAYFVMSLDPALVQSGNLFQVLAAAHLHDAVSRSLFMELGSKDLSEHAAVVVKAAIEDLVEFQRCNPDCPAVIGQVIKDLAFLAEAAKDEDLDQGDDEEGGAS